MATASSLSPGAAALLGQLRKSNRRRVRLDPASQFEQSWVVAAHALVYGTVTTDCTVASTGAVGDGQRDELSSGCSVWLCVGSGRLGAVTAVEL